MAKLKISGYSEMIDVPDNEAAHIKDLKMMGEKDKVVTAGAFTGEISKISSIIIEKDKKIEERDWDGEWMKARNERLYMNPETRARNSVGQFSLVYWMITRKNPTEEKKQEGIEAAKKFYEKNDKWAWVSLRWWAKVLDIDKTKKMDEMAFPILERVERKEMSMAGSPIL
jgi:hypothetical protein